MDRPLKQGALAASVRYVASFNPCFNGSSSQTLFTLSVAFEEPCFNPCFNGSSSQTILCSQVTMKWQVSSLIDKCFLLNLYSIFIPKSLFFIPLYMLLSYLSFQFTDSYEVAFIKHKYFCSNNQYILLKTLPYWDKNHAELCSKYPLLFPAPSQNPCH